MWLRQQIKSFRPLKFFCFFFVSHLFSTAFPDTTTTLKWFRRRDSKSASYADSSGLQNIPSDLIRASKRHLFCIQRNWALSLQKSQIFSGGLCWYFILLESFKQDQSFGCQWSRKTAICRHAKIKSEVVKSAFRLDAWTRCFSKALSNLDYRTEKWAGKGLKNEMKMVVAAELLLFEKLSLISWV